MPYKIVKKDDKWCVQKKDGSKTVGCHNSEEKAKRQMSALYANENKSIAEFSMAITKTSIPNKGDRTMRLSMVNSDTGEDAYEERMSIELFNDFVERIENNTPIPEPFNSVIEEGWKGGMPYLSISHYRSGAGKNVPGMPEKVYVDGERLKSSATLNENSLGLAVWKSVNKDLEERDKPIEERSYKYPIRISIGFLDLQHKHEIEGEEDFIFTRSELKQKCEKCEAEINGKVYLKGQLVHLAFTRVPANPRTQVEVLRMSDEIETRKDDAESIIGELAEELVGKSTVEDNALVVKAEKDYYEYANKVERKFIDTFSPPPQPKFYVSKVTDKNVYAIEYNPGSDYGDSSIYKIGYVEKDGEFTFDKRSDWVEMEYGLMPKKSQAVDAEWEIKFKLEEAMEENTQVKEPAVEDGVQEEEPVVEVPAAKSTVEESVQKFLDTFGDVKSKGLRGEAAIKALQPVMKGLADATNEEISDPTDAILSRIEKRMEEVIQRAFENARPELVKDVLKAMPKQEAAQEIPVPRSLQVQRSAPVQKQDNGPYAQIRALAMKSVQVGQQ